MIPESKQKGDIGAIKVISDLAEKGYVILTPLVCESLPFDVVAYKDGKFTKIQCKYTSNGSAPKATSWTDKHGSHKRKYRDGDFDYYGLYLPSINKVIYPSIKFAGSTIRSTIPATNQKFYWWEDFKDFTDFADKRSVKDDGMTKRKTSDTSSFKFELLKIPSKEELIQLYSAKSLKEIACDYKISERVVSGWIKKYNILKESVKPKQVKIAKDFKKNKISYPSKEVLQKMVWETPTTILAERIGVSDVALAKMCKKLGIEKPPRGYWAKKSAQSNPKTFSPSTLDEDRPPPYIG